MAVALAAAAGNTEDVNAAGGDIVVPAPASIASGDLRIHFVWQVGGPDSAPDIGTGYTNIGSGVDTAGSGNGIRAVYRIAGGSEGTGTHTTPGTDSISTGYGMRVTGAHATTPINTSAVGVAAAGTSPEVLPTVTTTVANCLIVYYFIHGNGTVTPTMAGVGTVFDTHLTNGSLDIAAIYSETQAVAGTSTARTVSWTGGSSSTVPYAVIAIAPAATDAAATPAVVTAAVSNPAPTVGAGVGVAPSVVTATVGVLAPTVTTGSDVAATPATVTATVSVPAPTVATGSTVSPTTVTATVSVLSPTATTPSGFWPTAVSANGRWIEDQHGDPWPALGDSNIIIHVVPHDTVDEVDPGVSVESYFDELEAHGFNAFWCKFVYLASGGLIAQDVDGNNAFTGTAFQSALTQAYLDNWGVIFEMAADRGITLFFFPTWLGIDDTEGDRALMEAASTTEMEDFGEELGTFFSQYPNLIWMNGGDRASPSATSVERWKNIQDGIIVGGSTHLWGLHGRRGVPHPTYISTNGLTGQVLDLNTIYQNKEEPANDAATAWGEDIGPTIAYEMNYENEDQSGDLDIIEFWELRNQYWGMLCAGANGHVYGNNPRWHMDLVAAYAVPGVTYPETWSSAGTEDRGTDDFSVFCGFLTDNLTLLSGATPDRTDTFLTSGEGTGITRSAARFDAAATSGTLAVAYRPHGGSATLNFDLTELAPASVRIRKMDPVSAAFTTIGTFATTGTESIGSLGNNSSGNSDWVLVFEADPNATATPSVVTASVSVLAPTVATGASTAPAVVTATVSVPAPTVTTGTSATPATVTATVGVLSPGVSAGGSATTTPNTVSLTLEVPAPTVATGASTAPTTVTAAVSIPAPTVTTGAGATPAAVTATVEVLAAAVVAGGSASVTPTTVTLSVSVPAPAVVAGTIILSAVRTFTPRLETRTVTPRQESRTHIAKGDT